jgi:ATP-dependent helicase HepA
VALDRDDVEFMTWDHPLVVSLMDLLLGSEAGNAAFSEVKASKDLPAGLYVEMIHLLEGSCPARFDLGRFLPVTPVRVLVDAKGVVCGEKTLEALDASTATDAARHALSGQGEALKPILDRWKEAAEKEAELRAAKLRVQVQKTMSADLQREIERVKSLQAKNQKSAGNEMELLKEELAALTKSIAESRVRLDAVRLIRVS